MSEATYTYRISVSDTESVKVQKRGPNDNNLGEPTGKFRLDEDQKTEIITLKEKAAYRPSAGEEAIAEDDIVKLGTALYNALFDTSLQNDMLLFYDEVVHKNDALLRIELDIDEEKIPFIASLPWEFLHVPANPISGDLWLATSPDVIFSRRRTRWIPPAPIALAPGEKLRIAIVVSAPKDESLGKVDYKKLYEELQKLANELGDQIELDLLDPEQQPATRQAIDRILEKQPHIFHFIGHGQFSKKGDQDIGEIAVMSDSGQTRWVDAAKFSNLFARHRPGIVFLQACEGGQLSSSTAFAGVASQIVQQNIPVVMAMQYEVSNATARRFAREFYTRLAAGEPVDKSAQEGRNAISDWHETRDFAIPVLFMRVADGHLFQREDGTALTDQSETPLVSESHSISTTKTMDEISLTQDAFSIVQILQELGKNDLVALGDAIGLDVDDFGPMGKPAIARELILSAQRRSLLDNLVVEIANLQPAAVKDLKANLYVFMESIRETDLMQLCQELELNCVDLKLDKKGLLGYSANKYIRTERTKALQDYMVQNGRYTELVQAVKRKLPDVDLSIFEY